MNSWSNGKSAALATLSIYRLVFVALSVDVMVRIWGMRGKFESPMDVVTLLFIEGLRTLVTLGGVAVAWQAARQASRRAVPAALAFAVSFATIAYTKAMTYGAFPGAVQEEVAKAFTRWHVPKPLLLVVFAQPEWAAWLALAALTVFAAQYPRRITAEDIRESGKRDRSGTMRGVAMVGADIGAFTRDRTARALESGAITPRRIWLFAFVCAVLHTGALIVSPDRIDILVHVGAAIVAAPLLACCVSLFRGSGVASTEHQRSLLEWVRRAAVAGFVLFVLSGFALLIPALAAFGFVGFALTPVAVLIGVAIALTRDVQP
jgi:hypothetical protein